MERQEGLLGEGILMGVKTSTYVIWGLALAYPKELDQDAIKQHLDNIYSGDLPEVLFLPDFMAHQYLVAGVCLKRSAYDAPGFEEIVAIPRGSGEKEWRLQMQDKTKNALMVAGIEIPPNKKFQWLVISHHR